MRAQVTSVSFFKRANGVGDLAQVRYVKAKRAGAGATEDVTHWIATLAVRLRGPIHGPQGAGLESARIQDRRLPSRARSAERTPTGCERARCDGDEALKEGGVRVLNSADCFPRRTGVGRDLARAGTPRSADPLGRLQRGSGLRALGFVGYQTDLEFEAGENFVGLGAGDLEGISFVAQDNHLFLEAQGRQGRHESHDPDLAAHLPDRLLRQLRASRCDRGRHLRPSLHVSAGSQASASAVTKRSAPMPIERRNFDYWFCGDASLEADRRLRRWRAHAPHLRSAMPSSRRSSSGMRTARSRSSTSAWMRAM